MSYYPGAPGGGGRYEPYGAPGGYPGGGGYGGGGGGYGGGGYGGGGFGGGGFGGGGFGGPGGRGGRGDLDSIMLSKPDFSNLPA